MVSIERKALKNAYFRLERTGGENTETVKKIKRSAQVVLDALIDTLPHNKMLPMGYIVDVTGNTDGEIQIKKYVHDGDTAVAVGAYIRGGTISRQFALVVATDVAEGLIGQIVKYLDIVGGDGGILRETFGWTNM